MKKQIPNIITLCNLACGIMASYCAVADSEHLHYAAYFILLGIFFDFFDGLAARLLGVASEMGKELDSLADVVTSGVAPGFILYSILSSGCCRWIAFAALATPVLAAYRLAKFNLDERQHHGAFLGLPAPANALIWVGLAFTWACSPVQDSSRLFGNAGLVCIATISIITAILMVTEIPMFSLKFNFKDLSWKSNWVRYLFLAGCTWFFFTPLLHCGVSFCILWYILLSLLTQKKTTAHE